MLYSQTREASEENSFCWGILVFEYASRREWGNLVTNLAQRKASYSRWRKNSTEKGYI